MAPCSKEQRQPEVECAIPPRHDPEPEEAVTAKPEPEKSQSKSSIRLELGTYTAARTPLLILVASLAWISYSFDKRDSRTQNLYMGNKFMCFGVSVLYILLAVVWGPRYMKNRDPIRFKKLIMLYNTFQVVFCSKIFYELISSGWFRNVNWFCQPNDYSNTPQALMVVNATCLFYWSKVLDFTDTFFFILNKKWNHISLLHVVHHSGMCLVTWALSIYMPTGHMTCTAFINSLVHIVMYTYYFLAAMGPSVQPYLWWKKYLTTMQLVQFVIVFLHNLQIFFNGCSTVPRGIALLFCMYSVGFFALFADFYFKEYRKGTARTSKATLTTTAVAAPEAPSATTTTQDSVVRERTTVKSI